MQDPWWGGAVNPAAKAQRKEQEGKYKAAARLYDTLARKAENPDNSARCFVKKADMLYHKNNYEASFQAYKTALQYSPAIRTGHVLKRLHNMARHLASSSGGLFGERDRTLAVDILSFTADLIPLSANAADNMLRLGRLYEEAEAFTKAKQTYREVISSASPSTEAGVAHFRLAQLLYEESKQTNTGGDLIVAARHHIDQYRDSLPPDSKGVERAEELLGEIASLQAQRLLKVARFYTWPGHRRPEVAQRYLKRLIDQFPDTPQKEKAQRLVQRLNQTDAASDDTGESEGNEQASAAIEEVQAGDSSAEKTGQMKKWLRPIEDLGLTDEKEDR